MQPGRDSDGADRVRERTFVERARRAQIVDATIETIAEDGLPDASFARIAARAGISRALISYHFDNKRELLDEVVATVAGRIDAAASTGAHGAESYPEALRAVIESMVRYYGTHPTEIVALGAILGVGSGRAGAADGELGRSWHARSVDEMTAFLDAGQSEGGTAGLRAMDSRTVAEAIVASLEAVPRQIFGRPDTDVDRLARELADVFVRATRSDGSHR